MKRGEGRRQVAALRMRLRCCRCMIMMMKRKMICPNRQKSAAEEEAVLLQVPSQPPYHHHGLHTIQLLVMMMGMTVMMILCLGSCIPHVDGEEEETDRAPVCLRVNTCAC